MNIKTLTASDFPGIDQAKFDEWKTIQLRANRNIFIALAIFFGTAIIAIPLIGGAIGWFLPCIAWFAFMLPKGFSAEASRRRQLVKELDMNRRLMAKRRGKPYAG